MGRHTTCPCAVILTALPIEYSAVRRHLRNCKEEVYKGTVYERGAFLAEACQWEIGIIQGGAGNASAATEAERAIDYFQPQVALFVGVAGGLKDVRIGDVVVGTKVYGYESGKATERRFLPRPDVGESSYRLIQRAQAEARKQNWLQRIRRSADTAPQAFVGPIAAGEKVIAATRSDIYRFLQTMYSDALAVEMEARGFLKAAHANRQVEALIVRGISDLIDDKHLADAANSQEIAARHASAFAFEVLANLCLEEQEIVSQKRMQSALEEGTAYLERGQIALLHGDYTTAKQHLIKAVGLLSEDQASEKSAQARYLLALVHLRGERPFGVTIDVWERVEELLRIAVQLNPCYSYLHTLALFEVDFSRHGWKKAQYIRESQQLQQEANNLPHLATDKANINLLWKCQFRLMQEMHNHEK